MYDMELGGNIWLEGFIEEQEANLTVVKKVVGRFTKQITQQHPEFKKFRVSFTKEASTIRVEGQLQLGEDTIHESATANNVYVALDAVLKDIRASTTQITA